MTLTHTHTSTQSLIWDLNCMECGDARHAPSPTCEMHSENIKGTAFENLIGKGQVGTYLKGACHGHLCTCWIWIRCVPALCLEAARKRNPPPTLVIMPLWTAMSYFCKRIMLHDGHQVDGREYKRLTVPSLPYSDCLAVFSLQGFHIFVWLSLLFKMILRCGADKDPYFGGFPPCKKVFGSKAARKCGLECGSKKQSPPIMPMKCCLQHVVLTCLSCWMTNCCSESSRMFGQIVLARLFDGVPIPRGWPTIVRQERTCKTKSSQRHFQRLFWTVWVYCSIKQGH